MIDSRGIFDANDHIESPLLRMVSVRAGIELMEARDQLRNTGAEVCWVHSGANIADSLTKAGYPARRVIETVLEKRAWRIVYDPEFESLRKRQKKGVQTLDAAPPVIEESELQDEAVKTILVEKNSRRNARKHQ